MDESAAVRADLAELRHEMQVGFTRMEAVLASHVERVRLEFTEQVERTRGELTNQIERTRGELTAQVERGKSDLMKWSFAFWVGAVGAIAALAGVL